MLSQYTQQTLRSLDHHEKGHKNTRGGEIVTEYRMCTAGMLGSCNHSADILLRLNMR